MKTLSLILMVFCFSTFAVAESDSITMSPYKVSFDLGFPRDAYDIKITSPEQKESLSGDISTRYLVDIKNKTGPARTMQIGLEYSENSDTVLTSDELKQVISDTLKGSPYTYNIDVATRTIDGSEGAIGAAEMEYKGFKAPNYYAMFYPVIDKYHLKCVIMSSFPWDEGTLQLLKTIHIEKINGTS